MQTAQPITLANDDAEIGVLLDGGCLAHYRLVRAAEAFELMRPWVEKSGARVDPLSVASFPLVPYFSRIRDGRFRFQHTTYQLPLNFGDHPHSLHGTGWQARWEAVEATSERVRVAFDGIDGGWPFPFRAEQAFILSGATLTHELSITNIGGKPMPAGLGMHPFFPFHGRATLRANVGAVWQYDDNFLPTDYIPCPPNWDLSAPQDVASLGCDTVFEGWDGRAQVTWPDAGVSLEITADPTLGRFCVYAPSDGDFFCAEPVSMMTDAFNRSADGATMEETGMRVLGPGETWSAWSRYRPERITV